MDGFKFKLLKTDIENLKTKKAKKEMFEKLRWECNEANPFILITYLIKLYPEIQLGTSNSHFLKQKLASLIDRKAAPLEDLIQYCDSDFSVSKHHYDKLVQSRYTTFQMLAYIAQHIKAT